MDSVSTFPRIKYNYSGSAAILETALQMANLGVEPHNKLRFVFLDAKRVRSGLLRPQFYVDTLSGRDIKNIILYLNFDMTGSPNFVRLVYDGEGSDTLLCRLNDSNNIDYVFLEYFAEQGLATKTTALSR